MRHAQTMKCLLLPVCLILNACGAPSTFSAKKHSLTVTQTHESPSFVDRHGHLKSLNGKLLDQYDRPIQLTGMSLFWSQWSGNFWNANVVRTMADKWGATLVRAAMGVEDQGGYLANRNEKYRVRTVVDAAIQAGIYVIIDWHSHYAERYTREAIDFFGEMASLYGQTPHVIFEIYNEPKQSSWQDVRSYAQPVIAAIRSKNARNLIIVGTPEWSQRVDDAAREPLDDDNLAYGLHFYSATHRQELRDRAHEAIAKGLTLFVSEFGTCRADGDGDYDFIESDRWLAFMEAHGLSWANWSLFNKPEKASALKPGTGSQGWWSDQELTNSGLYTKSQMIAARERQSLVQ